MNLTFSTEGADELLVFFILAILRETAKTSRTTIKGFGTLVEPLLQTPVYFSFLQDLRVKIKVMK